LRDGVKVTSRVHVPKPAVQFGFPLPKKIMLWCYDKDAGQWGRKAHEAAIEKKYPSKLFTVKSPEMKSGDLCFMRIPQWEPELTDGKMLAQELRMNGLILIPDLFTCKSYEDKIIQTLKYSKWMPKTFILNDMNHPEELFSELGFPFISKSREASASVNIRMIRDKKQAMQEFKDVMSKGIAIKVGKGRTGLQKGYVIWQKFCAGNTCDYRVIITGRHMMMLQRDCRKDLPFASGSGVNRPINLPSKFEEGALEKSREFFNAFDLKWCGIDLVYDYEESEWKILETTLGWSFDSYLNCRYFDTRYTGKDMFHLLIDEIKDGTFS
jgi:glutathione synthase/RimK-type ligase-like ATP-grasp enzyme